MSRVNVRFFFCFRFVIIIIMVYCCVFFFLSHFVGFVAILLPYIYICILIIVEYCAHRVLRRMNECMHVFLCSFWRCLFFFFFSYSSYKYTYIFCSLCLFLLLLTAFIYYFFCSYVHIFFFPCLPGYGHYHIPFLFFAPECMCKRVKLHLAIFIIAYYVHIYIYMLICTSIMHNTLCTIFMRACCFCIVYICAHTCAFSLYIA